MNRSKLTTAFACAVLISVPLAYSQLPNSAPSGMVVETGGTSIYVKDKLFVESAMEDNLAAIGMGRLALLKSNNEEVKELARSAVEDHIWLNNEMKPIAEGLLADIPAHASKSDRRTMAKLAALSGIEFDNAYLESVAKDNKARIEDYQTEVLTGQDPALRETADQGKKMIAVHLQIARQLAKE